MYECYKNALLTRCPMVLGRHLVPFSLGHAAVLTALESPVIDCKPVTTDDAIVGIYVCSMPYQHALDKISDGSFAAECKQWGEAVFGDDKQPEFDKFFQYIEWHTKAPPRYEFISKGGKVIKPEPGAVPWFFSVAWALMDRMPEARAWNMSLPLALSYYAAHCQFNGDEFLIPEPAKKDEA